MEDPRAWEEEVLALDPEMRDCLCKSGFPLLLMFVGAATKDGKLFTGEAPSCCYSGCIQIGQECWYLTAWLCGWSYKWYIVRDWTAAHSLAASTA